MISLARKLLSILDRADDARLAVLLLLVLLGAVVETLGVALIPAFVALLNAPGDVVTFLEARNLAFWVSGRSSEEIILAASLFLTFFFLAKNTFLVLLVHLQARFVAAQHAKLAHRLLHSYLHKPYTFHLERNTAQLLRNISGEAVNICLGVLIPGFLLVSELLVIVLVAALLIAVEPVASLVALLTIGITGLVYYRAIRTKLGDLGRLQQLYSGEMVKWVQQGLGGVKEAKVLGREAFFVAAFQRNVVEYARASRLFHTVNQLPRFLIETVAMVGIMAVIVLMIWSGRQVGAVLPSLALFAFAALRLMPSMNRIVSSANSLRYFRPSLEVVHADLVDDTKFDSTPARQSIPAPEVLRFDHALELRNVSYRYPTAENASLRNVSLCIPKGASVAFVGPSGAGKTTVVDVILGLLPPTHGAVLVDGRDIHRSRASWQRKIGYIPQSIYLSDDTVRRNVAFGLDDGEIRDQDVWSALEAAQLADVVGALPHGLDTPVGERGVRLSGGQRQRIGIARALYHSPEILIMDEATAALDNQTEREITQVLNRFHQQKTIIIIAHRLSTVKHCDTLFLMSEGEVTSCGSYDELLSTSEAFQQLVG